MFTASCNKDLIMQGSKWFAERSGRNKMVFSGVVSWDTEGGYKCQRHLLSVGVSGAGCSPEGSEHSRAVTWQGWDPCCPLARGHLSPSCESASQWGQSYSLREAFSSFYKALHEWHCRLRSLSLLSISLSLPCWCFIFPVSFVVLSLFEPNLVSMRSQGDFVALFFPLPGMRDYCFLLEKCNQCSAWRPGHCV